MELLFVHIGKPYGILENASFNFSSYLNISFNSKKREISIKKNETNIPNLFGSNIKDVCCIVGKNGVGKTTLMRYIKELFFEKRNDFSFRSGDIIIWKETEKHYVYCAVEDKEINLTHDSDLSFQFFTYERKPKLYDRAKESMVIYYSNNLDLYDDFIESAVLYNISTSFLMKEPAQARINAKINSRGILPQSKFEYFEFQRNREFLKSESIGKIESTLKAIEHVEIGLNAIDDRSYNFLRRKLNELIKNYERKEVIENMFEEIGYFKHILDDLQGWFLNFKREAVEKSNSILFFEISISEIIIYELTKTIILESSNFIERIEKIRNYIKKQLNEKNPLEFAKKYSVDFQRLFQLVNDEAQVRKNKLLRYREVIDLLIHNQRLWEISSETPLIPIGSPLLDEFIEMFKNLPFSANYIKLKFPRLSGGEEAIMSFYSRISSALKLKSTSRYSIILMIDEGDLYLHPEWQRKYFNSIVNYLSNYPEYDFQLILTTHSPIMLSDLPKENIIALKKNATNQVIDKSQNRDSFGGNILELFHDSFFLEKSFIGEFSEVKIDKLVKKINAKKINKDDLKLINKLGDTFLKNVLLSKIEENDSYPNKR